MIGKTIWIYDINCRNYRRDENGRSYGSPIFRDSFRPCKVIGETRVSWLLEYRGKVPKKGARNVAFSEEELDQLCYVEDNRLKIADMVKNLSYSQLKQVASTIGYRAI